jgi:TP901 family phage tail tape measure protein
VSNAQRTYAIRLTAQGKRELENYLESIGRKGQANLTRIHKAAGPASKGLRNVSQSSQRAASALSGLGRQVPVVEGLARALGATALATGVVRLGTSALTTAKVFQASMLRVQGVLRATEAQMAQLEGKAREMAASSQFRASDAASAIEMLAKNGLRYQDIMDGALDATMMLAGALGGELALSADLVTDLMAQFSLQAGDLSQITDLVTGAALNSKFGFDDLRLAIGQAGGVAGKFGVNISDFLTALAATSSAFTSGSDAGTSFKTFLQRLTPESKAAREAMQNLGLEFYDSQGRMKDLASIAQELKSGVSDLSEEARNEVLAKIFGTDAVRTALLLAEQGAAGIREIGDAIHEVSAADQAATRMQGLEGALLELSSAWEELQLAWADQGGLDVAETAIRRLTDVIRYLGENFETVNEIVERVANALAVVLVGRGINVAIARSVALRAAWIDMASSARMAGASASGAAVGMGRAAVAARLLTGALGGPAGLIMMGGALAALAINTDGTEEAMERASIAADKGAAALESYREASRKAADEQENLAQGVTVATSKMLLQSRAEMQDSLKDLRAAYQDLTDDLHGIGLFDVSEYSGLLTALESASRNNFRSSGGRFGELLGDIALQVAALQDGNASLQETADLLGWIAGVGQTAEEAVAEFDRALQSAEPEWIEKARNDLVQYAQSAGGFTEELEAIQAASDGIEATQAWARLRDRLYEASEAARILEANGGRGLRQILESAASTERKVLALEAALQGNLDLAYELLEIKDPFETIKDGAASATKQVKQLGLSIGGVYSQYQSSRIAGEGLAAAEGAKSGLLPLIRSVESSRDRRRAYNISLDHGRWTGGPRNLTGMTINEIIALQTQMLSHAENRRLYGNGQGSSALGAYQITRRTLRDYLMPNLGLDGSELFDERMQDRMAQALIRRRKGQGIAGLRNEWEGLRGVSPAKISAAMQTTAVPTVDPETAQRATRDAEEKARAFQKEQEATERLVEAGRARVDQLEFESSLVGKSALEQERLRYVQNALTEAKRQGINVDAVYGQSGETLRQVIERQADAIAKRRVEEDKARSAREREVSDIEGYRGALESAFEKIRKSPENIMEAFGDMADYISQRLWKLAMDPVIDVLANSLAGVLSGKGGGGGIAGFVASVFGRKDGGPLSFGRPTERVAIPARASGGSLQVGGRAQGRIQGSGTTTSDNILLLGSRDEFMMRARAVDHYGLEFMDAVNNLKLPRYATGGALARSTAMPAYSGGSAPVINLHATFEAPSNVESGADWGREAAAELVKRLPSMIDGRISHNLRGGGLINTALQNQKGR